MTEGITIAATIQGISETYSVLEKLGVLDKVLTWIRLKKKTDIILLGASGAGKSTFRNEIFGIEGSISRFNRTSGTEKKEGKVEGELINIIDTPGQSELNYTKQRQKAINSASRSRRLGIINVVSYGYHEGIVDVKEAIDNGMPRTEYLSNRRTEEENQLPEWVDRLCGEGGSAQWIINLVTKADLWWGPGAEEEVLGHYLKGSFHTKLGEAQTNKYQVLPYSGEFKKFYGITPMSGYYTDQDKNMHHNNLVATILSLCASMEDM